MANEIKIPISFYDLGNSLKGIANSFTSAIAGKGLTKGLETDIKNVQDAATAYQKQISNIKPGSKMELVDLEVLATQGDRIKKELLSLIQQTEKAFRGQIAQKTTEEVNKLDIQIDNLRESTKNLGTEIKGVNQVPINIGGTGFKAGITQLDTLQGRVIAFKQEIERLRELKLSGKLVDQEDINKLDDLESKEQAVLNVEKQIEERRQKIATLEMQRAANDQAIADIKKQQQDLQSKGSQLNEEEQRTLDGLSKKLQEVEDNQTKVNATIEEANRQNKNYIGMSTKTRDSIKNLVAQYLSFNMVLRQLNRVIRQGYNAVKQLDQSFTEIAMVTSYSTQEVWKMKTAFSQLANTTGLTITEVAKLSVEFFRQGRSYSEVIKLTEAAGIAAKLAGISVGDSVRYLTSALNGYKLSADQAMVVSDKFAALAAASATDYEELATALSKVAAQAYSAGVNMDNMMGFIAKALETTREAPENIGTAFKTIFARMQEIKDYGKTLEDGMDVNRVDKALGTIGVSLQNQAGELRNLDDILIDVGYKWKDLTKNQKAYIATALAGTRQQTRLLAVFEDFDRTMELSKVSSDSLGASYAQQQKYYESIEYATKRLMTAWQDFVTNIIRSDIVIFLTNSLRSLVDFLNGIAGNAFGRLVLMVTAAVYAFNALRIAMASEQFTKFTGKITEIIKVLTLQKVATDANTTSIWANITASEVWKAVSPYGWAIAAATAVVGLTAALVFFTVQSYNANGNLKNLEKTSRKFAAEAYNASKKTKDIDSLINKYKELAAQINLTAEEENQLAEYARQIQDLAGDKQVLNIDGTLNLEAVQEVLASSSEEMNKNIKDSYDNIIKGLGRGSYTYEQLDAISKQTLILGEAMKMAGVDTKEAFELMSKETQDYFKTLAETRRRTMNFKTIQVETGEVEDLTTGLTYKTYETTVVPRVSAEDLTEIEATITESVYDAWNQADVATRAEMLKNLTADMTEEQSAIIKEMLSGAETITKITTLFGDNAQAVLAAIGSDLDKVDKIFEKIDKFDLNKFQETILAAAILEKGPIEGYLSVVNQLGLSFEETLKIAKELNELEFANIDTEKAVARVQGMGEALVTLQKQLSGTEKFDIKAMKTAIETYPQIAKYIADNGQLSKDEIQTAMDMEDEKAKNELNNENVLYQNQIDLWEIQLKAYKEMMDDQEYLDKLTAEQAADLNKAGLSVMYADFKAYKLGETEFALRQAEIQAKANFLIQDDPSLTWSQALTQASNSLSGLQNVVLKGAKGIDDVYANLSAGRKVVQAAIDVLQNNIDQYRAFININNLAIQGIENGTLYFEELTDAVEDLIDAMTEIEKLLSDIAAIEGALAVLEATAENLSGQEYIENLNARIALTNELIDTNEKLIEANNDIIDTTLEQLRANPAFAESVRIQNGRLVTTKKFLDLGEEEKQLVLDLINAHNDSKDAINEENIAIQEGISALEEYANEQKETVKTTKEFIINALKDKAKKELDIATKEYEEEKKILDKRKAMYDEAFAEEDYTNSLEDTASKREDIINKLAALEGATDLASIQKRQELLKEKADLDKEYNTTVRDYNRDALRNSLDERGNTLDSEQQEREDDYEEYTNNIVALEAEATALIEGEWSDLYSFLANNSEEYKNSLKQDQEDMIANWQDYASRARAIISGMTGVGTNTGIIEEATRDEDLVANTAPGTPAVPWSPKVGDHVRATQTGRGSSYGTGTTAKANNVGYITSYLPGRSHPYLMSSKPSGGTSLGWYQQSALAKFQRGGLLDFTGPAWVDGSPQRPERILSPVQTELFDKMVNSLQNLQTKSSLQLAGTGDISIGHISITTPQLNNNQDFAAAGKTLAAAFNEAISTRGLAINKKR